MGEGGDPAERMDSITPTLTRETGIPLYLQVKEGVRDLIATGGLQPGDPLPGEMELQERFGVSRATVRQALAELSREGRIERHQGRGTFVAIPRLLRSLPELTSFSEHLTQQGLRSASRLLAFHRLAPNNWVAEPLAPDEVGMNRFFGAVPLVRFVRLRLANATPIGLHVTATPSSIADEIGLTRDALAADGFSFYAALESRGHRLAWAEEHLAARGAGPREAELLDVRPLTPVMSVLRVSRDEAGSLVEAVRAVYLGDKYDYVVQLERRARGGSIGSGGDR